MRIYGKFGQLSGRCWKQLKVSITRTKAIEAVRLTHKRTARQEARRAVWKSNVNQDTSPKV